jgi:hypothetical protein
LTKDPRDAGKDLASEFLDSGLGWVVTVFSLMAALNVLTYLAGQQQILRFMEGPGWWSLASVAVFDSWGTVGGLLGVVALFVPFLMAVGRGERKRLSIFFVATSVGCGYAALLIWNLFLGGGTLGYGASAIPIAAQSVLFGLSVVGVAQLVRGAAGGSSDRFSRAFFPAVYLVLIVSTLALVLVIQPIFIPTELYNWQAHELAFLLGLGATAIYCGLSLGRTDASTTNAVGRLANASNR